MSVSYCINPKCPNPDEIPDDTRELICPHCSSKLVLHNRYRVERLLGSGGFGKTFEAIDSEKGEDRVVVKVLYRNHPKAVELFKQEAKVLCRLNHPGIPHVDEDGYFVYWAHGSKTPLHCLVMEKIEGLNLVEWIDERDKKPIDAEIARNWLEQLVDILDRVHQLHYFHRDIKPHNIMRRPDGQLALIDFGTAREVTGTYINKVGGGQNVTEIISAGYTPPEQINGKAVPQSDFYALGRTFVFLMTGKKPTAFPENPRNGKLLWHEEAPQIPEHFANVIDYMMAPFPGNRPQHGRVIFQALDDSTPPGSTWERSDAPARDSRGGSSRKHPFRTTGSSFRTNSRLRSSRSTRAPKSRIEAWQEAIEDFFADLHPPEIRWDRVIEGAIVALILSQIYGYWRYGFFPSNPARLVVELPDSLFLERLISRDAGYVRSLALSPNGQQIVSGSFGTLRFWNLETGALENQVSAHQDWIEALVFLDDRTVATASGTKDPTIRFWNAETGVRKLTLIGHTDSINALLLAPDRKTLISASSDKTIRLWNITQAGQVKVLRGHNTSIEALAISPDGRTLASGGRNGTIRLWDLTRGVQLRAIQAHAGRVLSLAFSPDGKTLTSSSSDRSIRFWNTFPGEEVKSFTDLATPVRHLVYVVDTPPDHPEADSIVQLMGTTQSLLVWRPETGERLHSLWGSRSPISALASTADGTVIVTGSPEKTIQIWRLPDMAPPPP